MWLRLVLRPQNPHLLCVRLGSCVASMAAGPGNGLGPLNGAGEVDAAYSQAPISPPSMHPAPFMCGLGSGLALEMG